MKARKKNVSRISALLLALVMMLSLVPTTVFAAGSAQDTTIVIAGSDFQNNNCTSTDHTAGTNAVRSLLAQIKGDIATKYGTEKKADGFLFCGDYYKDNNNQTAATNGLNALKACVKDELGSGINALYVQGNHDVSGVPFDSTGAHDAANYGVYEMNWDQYNGYNASYSASKTMAGNLRTYFAGRKANHPDQPIFIISHQGLHAGPRTIWGDGYDRCALYAMPIFNAINEAAAGDDGLNIIFLFAHNHSKDFDSYLGGSAVFLKPGDTMLVSDADVEGDSERNCDHFTTQTLNFTYMNAGYVGYYDSYDANGNRVNYNNTLTMSCFEIQGNQVTISRYDTEGLHDLKIAGAHTTCQEQRGTEMTNFVNNFQPDTKVYTSPQVVGTAPTPVDPEPDEQTFTDPSGSGIKVVTTSGTALSVSQETVADSVLTEYGIDKYQAYDINIAGYEQGKTVKVSMPVPDDFDADKTCVYHVNSNGTLEDMGAVISDGVATFTTNHFSIFMLGESELDWKTIGTSVGTTPLTSLSNGQKIVIQCNRNTNYYVTNTAGTNANRLQMITDKTNSSAFWNVTQNTDGTFYLQDADGKYMTLDNSTAGMTNTATKLAITYSKDYSVWEIKNNSKNYYLNQYSQGSMAAGYSKGVSDKGSRWNLYEVVSGYAALGTAGDLVIPTGTFTTASAAEAYIREHLVVYTATNEQGTDKTLTDAYTLDGTLTPTVEGDNILTVKYNGVTLGTVKVTFMTRNLVDVSIDTDGTVYLGDGRNTFTGAYIVYTYDKGESDKVPITLNMVSGNYDINKVGTYEGQKVNYDERNLDFTLHVEVNPNLDPFPKNPNKGSVTIDKHATGIDFKETGVAQVELSAKGIPYSKGVDVIVMLDASSSMAKSVQVTNSDGTKQNVYRSYVFADSFRSLLTDLKTAGGDINIAIADFNGFGNGGQPYTPSTSDTMTDNQNFISSATTTGHIYTGWPDNPTGTTSTLTADAFVKASEINVDKIYTTFHTTSSKTTGTPYQSGTNYDYAFWATYQLGSAITAKNKAAGEDRDLIVVFMTDGAANQYNGYVTDATRGTATHPWSWWLTGSFEGETTSETENDFTQYAKEGHKYFFGGVGKYAQKNRWNEAVKGDPKQDYQVIDRTKNTASSNGINQYMDTVRGLGATVYSIGYLLADDGYITIPCAERLVHEQATSDDYFALVNNENELNSIFGTIKDNIVEAATNAHFEDEMGAQYDLWLDSFEGDNTSIEVLTYDIWTRNDYASGKCTIDQIGMRKGTSTTIEKVFFEDNGEDGKIATSSLLDSDNIMTSDGLIIAKNFVYNTTDVERTTKFNGKDITVGAESFYWNLGTVGEKEYALKYYVYLTGSMEGRRDEGNYPTNDHATLFYNNYAGADVSQDAPIPIMPWKAAIVKYAAYLVNGDGDPIDTKGNVTGFGDRVVVTNPQEGGKILFNSEGAQLNAEILATRLPDEYTLYDEDAAYTVKANSDGTGSWTIRKGAGKQASTYVTGFGGTEPFSKEMEGRENYSYTATTVWFAVVCNVGAIKDAVVIDYGMPVDISVMSNDMFFDKGTLDSVGNLGTITPEALKAKNGSATKENGFSKSFDAKFGKATVRGNYVRYQVNEMKMDKADIFHYAVNYQGDTQQGYYYGEVAVIPATTIYYEDNFVSFDKNWKEVGKTNSTATQDEDRPGEFNLTTIDANNVYGFDRANMECNEYSMGSAHKATVSKGDGAMPTATFTFTGSAFDVVSRTSNTDGVMLVDVIGVGNDTEEYWIVDNYYGCTCTQDGYIKYTWKYGMDEKWHVIQEKLENRVPNTDKPADGELVPGESTFVICEPNYTWTPKAASTNTLYQIPVIKSPDLGYGTYEVTIYTMYSEYFDHTGSESYDMYLDAIRIYNPTNNDDSTSLDAYKLDKEAYPQYMELRNNLIDADTLAVDGSGTTGVVFIDGINAVMSEYHEDGDAEKYNSTKLDDFTKYGPNNEVYLAKGQAVAFQLTNGENSESVQLGVKALNGEASIKVDAIGKNNTRDTKAISTKAATDMYYDITNIAAFGADGNSRVIVITNLGDNLVSLTNIKVTYAQAPTSSMKMMMSAPMARMAANYVSTLYLATFPVAAVVDEEPTVDQTEDPEVITPVDPADPVTPVDPEENAAEETTDNTDKDGKKDKKDDGKKDTDKSSKSNKFKPEKMDVTVDKNDIKVGDKVTVTVKTSPDVAAVTVNGEDAKLNATDSTTGEETWTFTAKADEVGDMTNSVVAFDEAGNASEVVDNTDTVQEKEHRTLGQIIMSFIRWIINWISGWFKG